jgi:hypothetical protein
VKKLNLNAIRIDGGTQSRVEINNEAVGDYAEAIKVGIDFPAIVVFHDGADYWLADGFHRYHAHKQAGKASIDAEVHSGTVRDATLFSLGANCTHGLRRTNADKRKAVTTLLADGEWAKWSDRKIAEVCGVGHPFVAALRRPEVAAKQQENRVASATKKTPAMESDSTPTPPSAPAKAPAPAKAAAAPLPADEGPTAAEIAAAERAAIEEIEALRKIAMTDDKLAAALAESKQLRALNRVLQERNDGLMNEKNELVKRIKALQRKIDKLEKSEQPA